VNLTPKQLEARRAHLVDQEMAGPEHRYWLSFCDPNLPKGQTFLGACVVRAHGVITASQAAWDRGCNPGGEMACWELPDSKPIDERFIHRLLSRAEIEEAFGAVATLRELCDGGAEDPPAICAECHEP
jgi:hypothetical protein